MIETFTIAIRFGFLKIQGRYLSALLGLRLGLNNPARMTREHVKMVKLLCQTIYVAPLWDILQSMHPSWLPNEFWTLKSVP